MKRYAAIRRSDDYSEKLAALLPAEMVAVYTALLGIVAAATDLTPSQALILKWIVFAVSLIATVIYLWRKMKVARPPMSVWQLILTAVSFAIWAMAMGNILLDQFDWWKLTYQNLIVAGWTFLAPILIQGEE